VRKVPVRTNHKNILQHPVARIDGIDRSDNPDQKIDCKKRLLKPILPEVFGMRIVDVVIMKSSCEKDIVLLFLGMPI
jgi:hypothetical protein